MQAIHMMVPINIIVSNLFLNCPIQIVIYLTQSKDPRAKALCKSLEQIPGENLSRIFVDLYKDLSRILQVPWLSEILVKDSVLLNVI